MQGSFRENILHLRIFQFWHCIRDDLILPLYWFQPGKGSKKAKKSGSNIFSLFSQKQIQEFKEAFGIIDVDKDGIITAPDLKAAFVNIGRPITDAEANNLVGEAPGPINFTQMVTLFAEKMAGGKRNGGCGVQCSSWIISGTDDDDVIIRSFEAFEINGQIDAEM